MQGLPFETLTQFVALGLTLIAGWFLGLASAPGGRKWRDRYYDEELSNAGYRDRAETDLRDATRRIRDLEAENARLRADAPVAAPVEPVREGHSTAALAGAAVAGAAAGAVATHAVHEHHDAAAPVAAPAPVPVPAPAPAPAPVEPVAADHAEPAIANGNPDHAEPARIAHESPADPSPAPADAHQH